MHLTLTHQPSKRTEKEGSSLEPLGSLGWVEALFLAVVGAVTYGLCRKLYRYNPPPKAGSPASPKPLGGWLLLLGIGPLSGFIRDAVELFRSDNGFVRDLWAHLVQQQALQSTWGDLVMFGVFVVILFTMAVVPLALFFQRRSSFPRVFYWLSGIGALFILVAQWEHLRGASAPSASELQEYGKIVVSLLWCAYLARSQRARETFVRRLGDGRAASPPSAHASDPSSP